MKKVFVIIAALGFTVGLSSCYRQSVCATYVKHEQKIDKTIQEEVRINTPADNM